MKRSITAFAFIFLLSCSKDSDNTESGPYIKYTAGTTQFEFKGNANAVITGNEGVYVTKFPGNVSVGTVTQYLLMGQKDLSTGIRFEIDADSLKTELYHCYQRPMYGSPAKVAFSGKAYSTFATDGSQKISVQITRHSKGTADGTFQGTLYSFDTPAIPMEIKNGEFKNVPVVYYQ